MPDKPPSPDAADDKPHGERSPLRAADLADVTQALAFALRFAGRKRVDSAAEAMAHITAERLFEHLRVSGFAVMRQPQSGLPHADYSPPGATLPADRRHSTDNSGV